MQSGKPTSSCVVSCPACGKEVVWAEVNRYRPFCSARCKGIDLGAWASERYRVPATEEPEPDAQIE